MLPRMSPPRARFSNRQAVVFFAALLVGLAGGWVAGDAAGGMMAGAVVGAGAILLPGLRREERPAPPTDPPDPAGMA